MAQITWLGIVFRSKRVKKWDWLRARDAKMFGIGLNARCLSKFFHSLSAKETLLLQSKRRHYGNKTRKVSAIGREPSGDAVFRFLPVALNAIERIREPTVCQQVQFGEVGSVSGSASSLHSGRAARKAASPSAVTFDWRVRSSFRFGSVARCVSPSSDNSLLSTSNS